MSEQKQSFMQQLDGWMNENVIDPLIYGERDEAPGSRGEEDLIRRVKSAIREKVLESYHNGQAAGTAPKSQRSSVRPRRQFSTNH